MNTEVTIVLLPRASVVVKTNVVGPTWPFVEVVYPIGPPPASSVDVAAGSVERARVAVGIPLASSDIAR